MKSVAGFSVRGLFSPYILQIEAQMFIDSWQQLSEVLWRAIVNGNDGLTHLSAKEEEEELKDKNTEQKTAFYRLD